MNKNIAIVIVALLAVGGGSFYGGMKYDQGRRMSQRAGVQGQFQVFNGADGTGGNARFRAGPGGAGGFVGGEILKKDASSITVKMMDGSTKIVLLTGTTMIGKTDEGTTDDLQVGKQVIVNGTANSDGTVAAQNIQIRPIQPISTQAVP